MDFGTFQITPSSKSGLDSHESYVVARRGVSYLRVLGSEPEWEVMTATASEDDGSIKVCGDTRRLVMTAIRVCQARGLHGFQTKKDRLGREYVKMAIIRRDDLSEPLEDLRLLATEFFEVFDESAAGSSVSRDDLVDLYEDIASGSDKEDVYLSDGLWLGSDGSLHDRGR